MRQQARRLSVTVIIGTSGWQYRDWRGRFYPQKLPQRLWLEHYAAHFDTVASNNAFYRLPELETFVKWRERTPPDFRWAVEPRHESWWTDEIRALLERYGAALCWADRGEKAIAPLWRTTDWGYLRFHYGFEQW